MSNLAKVIRDVAGSWSRERDLCWEAGFVSHNQRVWKDYALDATEGEILLERFSFPTAIVAQSYFVNLLAKRFNARIRAYRLYQKGSLASERMNTIYSSFNAESFEISFTSEQLFESEKRLDRILGGIRTKRDVEELRLDGVLVGDLIYDSHLMKNRVPTVEIGSSSFQESLKGALNYYVFWRDYLNSHNVKAVIVSHCVYYESALILRLAITRGIPSYQVNATHVYRLSEKDLWAYTEFRYYPEEFRRLSADEQKQAMELAQQRIEKRFNGDVGLDMGYSKKSAYARKKRKRVLAKSDRIKVLIATHCFFDSPHGYGIHLFPDFYEWLDFLGKISEKTNYDWYIKTHPDYLPGTMEIVKDFVGKYPKWTLLPADASHLQLIEDGLDFTLTVYGTIGFEYAALKKYVVNASTCNPHIAYNFNFNPRTTEEYEDILMNLPRQNLEIDVKDVYEYYYLHFIDNVENWLYSDFSSFLKEIGGYHEQSKPISYNAFMKELSDERHQVIIRSLENFIDSGEFNLRRRHLALPKN